MSIKRNTKGQFSKEQFTTEKIESKKYPLSGGFYTVRRSGQGCIGESDQVNIRACIYLPKTISSLSEHLNFCKRVEMVGRYLHFNWGWTSKTYDGFRLAAKCFLDDKWAKGFARAEKYAKAELDKLENALQDRENALIDAEY